MEAGKLSEPSHFAWIWLVQVVQTLFPFQFQQKSICSTYTYIFPVCITTMGLCWWLSGKEPICQGRRDTGLIPDSRRSNPLKKEMTNHPVFFAWEIPWIEEPGGLQSMGSQKIQT